MEKKDNRWFMAFRCYKYPDYKLLDIKGFIAEDLRLCVHTFNTVNKGKRSFLVYMQQLKISTTYMRRLLKKEKLYAT